MAKPIGKQVLNRQSGDKVGYRTVEKFAPKSLLAPGPAAPKPEDPVKKPAKYKTRKK